MTDDYIREFLATDRLGALLGARFVSLDAEACVYECEARREHLNPSGILHGGALFTVMDSSQGMLVCSVLEPPYQAAATGTATIRYLAPVRTGTIRVRTTLTRREGRKLFVHSEARAPDGQMVALLDEIWIAVPRAMADGASGP
jgi:uncharacterized protein (TIGR00369 family)